MELRFQSAPTLMRHAARTLVASVFLALPLPAQHALLTDGAGHFELGGAPIQIISGEMHYARIPRAYWRARLRMARAMGLNTISTYVFWNFHETRPGEYDFSGQRDIAEYIRIAQQEGLHVILRPGPYVCAEWDLGGYPAWLLADSTMLLRSTQAAFIQPAERWLQRLGRELVPLLASHGGPIIAVQVENEYGSFGKDAAYMAWQRDALRRADFGSVRLYTADGDVQLKDGTLPDLPAVVNFGTGDADSSFARLARFRPGLPLMSGEYWAGWFDQWGGKHERTDAGRQTAELDWMLSRGYSVNLYMFHGGSTPGFMNGANIDGNRYHPQTSSYDYDAALDESGRPTPKYFAFRDVIAKRTGTTPPAVPATSSTIAIPAFTLRPSTPLWTLLRTPIHTVDVRPMESFGQSYGYIVYRTHLATATHGVLAVHDVRDYAQVYVNRELVATLDRRLAQDTATIDAPADAELDIVVENGGRVNFGRSLRGERQGITREVLLGGAPLHDWDVFPLPMAGIPALHDGPFKGSGPAFFRGSFTLSAPGDSYLDTRGWGKGIIWVNGHLLGRFWDIGPQLSSYVPAPWLKRGTNEVVVFDLVPPATTTMSGVTQPVWR